MRVQLMVGIKPKLLVRYVESNVIVLPVVRPVLSIITVSFKNGAFTAFGVPPEDVAHAVLLQLPPATKLQ